MLMVGRSACLFAIGLSMFAILPPVAHAGPELAGSEWRPQEIGGAQVPPEPEIFVRFGSEGRLEGHGGCNRFFGSYRLSGDKIEFGPIGATRMACPEPVMDRENRFLRELGRAQRFARDRIDLLLTDDRGNVAIRLIQTDAD